jgi:translation initiation factor IF-3
VRFRGREIFHPDIGREMLEQMAETLRDVATIEQRPLMEGRALSLLLAPSAKAKPPRQQSPNREQAATVARQEQAPAAPAEPDGNNADGADEAKEG